MCESIVHVFEHVVDMRDSVATVVGYLASVCEYDTEVYESVVIVSLACGKWVFVFVVDVRLCYALICQQVRKQSVGHC